MRREWIEISSLSPPISSKRSPSMRREWIEIDTTSEYHIHCTVSLHAEGVD